VYEPSDRAADDRVNRSTNLPPMTAGRAALVSLMSRYLGGLMCPSVSLLEVHKLMYFLQQAGEPLRLRYVRAPCGPFAESLRHVLKEIEGHYVAGYADGGDAPDKQLTLVPGAVEDAQTFLATQRDTLQRFERVARLVEGFESAFGLELLATVHWVMNEVDPSDDDWIRRETHAWSPRKREFSAGQITLAANRLREQGWAGVAPAPA